MHPCPRTPVLPVLIWLAATASLAPAESFVVGSSTIISGGGALSGGGYEMTAAVAIPQSDVGMSGGTYGVQGGFFGGYHALQQAGAPRLALTIPSAGVLRVIWPAAIPGWRLEQSTTLATGSWTDVLGAPQTSGTSQFVDVAASGRVLFVRLRKL